MAKVFNYLAKPFLLSIVIILPGLHAAYALPFTHPASMCDQAARIAAIEKGVPVKVMRAITLTETGQNRSGTFVAWPWTVNMEGRGIWLETRNEAESYLKKGVYLGARNFDVGCFQLNYRWHGKNFETLRDMLDPKSNARYAAEFLKSLYLEYGDWVSAAGAFHSRTPEKAKKYLARLSPILLELDAKENTPIDAQLRLSKRNSFPLLRGKSVSSSRGSLFPTSDKTPNGPFIPPKKRG